jgi:hypothetical protein
LAYPLFADISEGRDRQMVADHQGGGIKGE